MKKLILTIFLILCFVSSAYAKSCKVNFNSIIKDSGIDKNSISMSIKDTKTGKVVYSLNDEILMHPASVQKVLTTVPAVEALTDEYEFSTTLYKIDSNKYLIKLGADPLLTSRDLKSLVSVLKPDTKRIYINDSIIEAKDWGEGWQWDDDMNPSMPHFSSYNLDGNIIKLTIMPDKYGEHAIIINPSKYPFAFINNVKVGDTNNISITRNNTNFSNSITIDGTINSPTMVTIPSNNTKRYFETKLTRILEDNKIYLKDDFTINNSVIPSLKKENEIKHPISEVVDSIFKNSNNIMAETVLKVASGAYYDKTGTDTDGIELFKAYCNKKHLDISRIRLVDASGVSKNNLVTTNFVTEFLLENSNNKLLEALPSPGEGTLSNRLLNLNKNLKAKTGTLSDISSLAGYLTSKSGNKYAFCIIINTPNTPQSEMKELEDYIIREVYLKL